MTPEGWRFAKEAESCCEVPPAATRQTFANKARIMCTIDLLVKVPVLYCGCALRSVANDPCPCSTPVVVQRTSPSR